MKKPDRTRWDDRRVDHDQPYLERAERARRLGVVAIVATQEFQWVYSAKQTHGIHDRVLTPEGIPVAVFYTKLHHHLGPLLDPTDHQLPSMSAEPPSPSTTP